MSNLSILDWNIIHGLGCYADPEGTEAIYLRHRHLGVEEAERRANGWARLASKVVPMVRAAERLHGGKDAGALAFVRERYVNLQRAA